TGAGAAVLSSKGRGPKLVGATLGKVVDFGITDANNMGAAMAPAAADTLYTHFMNCSLKPGDYDLVVTGDLGAFGSRIFKYLMWEKGFDISERHVDCGELIYNIVEDEFQGGSGAGCSAIVFNGYLYKKLCNKEYKRIILLATGALLSSVSSQQGESIPSIAHAAVFES
ncbi:MAG: stage V sporulation protein AD, partial [Eubacteriales bacterium]